MTHRFMSTLNAVVLAAFGVMFLALPEFSLELFGVETYTATIFVARFFGAALALTGMVLWMAKDLGDARAAKTLTIMLLAGSVIGFILTLVGMVGVDVIRANGWILLVIHIIFALGYGYMLSGVTIVTKTQQQRQY
ncbi:MAG: hypothetical protein KPEEDBHJ_03568 [Anaerolineales bacterium]|nr:hypothetical protein [Anaerolineales bacterium]